MRPDQVDRVEIITLVDNVIENWRSEQHENVIPAGRWVSGENVSPSHTYAGHGLAFLVKTYVRNNSFSVLYDAGPSGDILIHNIRAMGLNLHSIDSIIMSHGHWDHFGGLRAVLIDIGRNDVPVYLHPRMFCKRRVFSSTKEGERIRQLPDIVSINEIEEVGGIPRITTEPALIAGHTILRTGEIPRETEYERGFPNHQAFIDGEWVDDSEIIDDNCLVIDSGEGIIIITGCAHSGVVNSVKEAIRLTGINEVQAIIGGFHLGGPQDMSRIERTIHDLKSINPTMIVPCHCTATIAQHMIANAFPKAYVIGSVGTLYRF